jgi:hypothetical protein
MMRLEGNRVSEATLKRKRSSFADSRRHDGRDVLRRAMKVDTTGEVVIDPAERLAEGTVLRTLEEVDTNLWRESSGQPGSLKSR